MKRAYGVVPKWMPMQMLQPKFPKFNVYLSPERSKKLLRCLKRSSRAVPCVYDPINHSGIFVLILELKAFGGNRLRTIVATLIYRPD
ncbi:hypothetical protein D3C81_1702100 [compost metagenome]